uniref:Ovule protein n=1 Tax=Steinernema glaseri TaxID=37863 RepID=A0A1I7YXI7_9BILA
MISFVRSSRKKASRSLHENTHQSQCIVLSCKNCYSRTECSPFSFLSGGSHQEEELDEVGIKNCEQMKLIVGQYVNQLSE